MQQLWEKLYPWVGAVLVAVAAAKWFPVNVLPADLGNVFAGTLNIGAIAVGFLATAKSILISMEGRRVIQQLRRAGTYDLIVRYLLSATRAAFLLSVLSVVGLVLQPRAQGWAGYFLVAGVAVATFAGLASYRVIEVFAEVLRAPDTR